MAEIRFSKWQGTGNDFIIMDNRDGAFNDLGQSNIEQLCDRRFGIGADGLMFLNNNDIYDFSMQYFNSDGLEAEMCGNGGRCMVGFAWHLGIIRKETRFLAKDGVHKGRVLGENNYMIQMIDLIEFKKLTDSYFLNTGVPHVVKFVDDLNNLNVVEEGSAIRYSEQFRPEGTNVNFVSFADGIVKMRTYERGVENETLSCGTGAVASAIASYLHMGLKETSISCHVPGGQLDISCNKSEKGFTDIYLKGPAKMVFEGTIDI